MKSFTLCYTPEAKKRIQHLHPIVKQQIRQALDELKQNPWAGKPLKRELAGLHSLRVQHYRTLYHINDSALQITILTLGKRKTIYEEMTGHK